MSGIRAKFALALTACFLIGAGAGWFVSGLASPLLKARSLKAVELGLVRDFPPGSVTDITRLALPGLLAEQQGRRPATDVPIPKDSLWPVRLWLVRDEEEGFRALYAVDPARGCSVTWRPSDSGSPGYFLDPCGGVRWSREGACLSSFGWPCKRELDRFPVAIRGERVYADLSTLILGRPPEQ